MTALPSARRNEHVARRIPGSDLADELRPGQSVELLQELHILTREGKLNQDSRRKLKQVYHLYQFIEKILIELSADTAIAALVRRRRAAPKFSRTPSGGPATPVLEALETDTHGSRGITVADHGAGKSYLGFILYDLFFRARADGWIYGIETRPELVQKSRDLARKLGFGRMSFLNLSVSDSVSSSELPDRIDLVTALHACDTATDDAIAFGLQKKARAMVLVPCCQAEVARLLNAGKALNLRRSPLAELWRHPLHTREVGSQLSNVLRCLYLEAWGYQVTVTELVGWEHSLKNELIIARLHGGRRLESAERLQALLGQFGLEDLQNSRYRLTQFDTP